jgi:hypothetical protein
MSSAASIAAMRPFMRFFAVLLGGIALYVIYVSATALAGRSVLPPSTGAFMLVLALLTFVPAYLVWRQVEAATRYINEPTVARLADMTAAMRHFWRLGGIVAVLQLTVFIVGFALRGGL